MKRAVSRVLRYLAVLSLISAFAATTAAASSDAPGAVYTQTNKAANEVLIFDRAPDGSLASAGRIATGGSGTGTGGRGRG